MLARWLAKVLGVTPSWKGRISSSGGRTAVHRAGMRDGGRSSALATKRIEQAQCERFSRLIDCDCWMCAMASARLGSLRAASSWMVIAGLWGQRLMDGDGLGWIDIDTGMLSTL